MDSADELHLSRVFGVFEESWHSFNSEQLPAMVKAKFSLLGKRHEALFNFLSTIIVVV